jgi:hypothetical protein
MSRGQIKQQGVLPALKLEKSFAADGCKALVGKGWQKRVSFKLNGF